MPNRILRDWTDSEAVNQLSAEAERHLNRLIMKADDFGRLPADPRILRPMLYPFKLDQVSEADVSRWTAECCQAGIIRLYEVEKKVYLVILKFDQRLRAKRSKYPQPDGHPPPSDSQMTVTRRPESEAEARIGGERREESIGEPAKKPPAPKVRIKRDQPDTPWQRMVDHIWMDWQKRKGVPYTTIGSEFRDLKRLAEIHQPEGVMALWDLHVRRLWYPDRSESETDRKKSEYWKARGHDVITFCQNVNFLVDDPAWKPAREKYLRQNADLAKPADIAAGEEAVSPEEINALVQSLVHKEAP